MHLEGLENRKFFGRFSLLSIQIFGLVILTVALGILSFRYYAQQLSLIAVYEHEAKGADLANRLMSEIINASATKTIDVKTINQIQETLRMAWQSEFTPDEMTDSTLVNSVLFENNLDILSHHLNRALVTVVERSNLILDADFDTYYIADAFFTWMPQIFFQQNTLLSDLKNHENFETRRFCLNQFLNDLKKVNGMNWAADDFKKHLDAILSGRMYSIADSDLEFIKDSSFHLLNSGYEQFKDKNNLRIENKKTNAFWLLSLSIAMWIVSLAALALSWFSVASRDSSLIQIISDQKNALEKNKKLATLGEISASIGHDISNPLAVIESSSYLLERDHLNPSDLEAVRHVHTIQRMVLRIYGINASIRSFLGENSNENITNVDLSVVFDDLTLLLRNRLMKEQVQLILDFSDADLYALGSESAYVQIFVNLVNNAIEAMRNSSKKIVAISAEKQNQFLNVYVQDTGPGVAPEIQDRIFESFFTTKASEGGTGLGLSICCKVIQSFGGQLSYVNQPQGACFLLKLPTLDKKKADAHRIRLKNISGEPPKTQSYSS